jgi:hypothetical protein
MFTQWRVNIARLGDFVKTGPCILKWALVKYVAYGSVFLSSRFICRLNQRTISHQTQILPQMITSLPDSGWKFPSCPPLLEAEPTVGCRTFSKLWSVFTIYCKDYHPVRTYLWDTGRIFVFTASQTHSRWPCIRKTTVDAQINYKASRITKHNRPTHCRISNQQQYVLMWAKAVWLM